MNKKHLFILLAITLIGTSAFAQRKKDIKYAGFLFYDSYYFMGPLNFHMGGAVPFYSGDLCGGLGCNQINPGFLLGASYKFAPGTYAAVDFQYLQMGATDKVASRNLSFSSTNYEFTAYVRYNFIKDIILKHYHMDQKPRFIKPYMKLGIGIVNYNPVAVQNYPTNIDTSIVEGTHGNIALIIPVGLGLSFNFSNKVAVLLDVNYRYTLTDYLDGVSERAGTGNKDAYLTANLTLSYSPWAKRLKPKKRKAPEGTTVPTGGGGAAPSSGSGSSPSGGNASPAPGAGSQTDDQIVPEDTNPEPEEDLPYEGYEDNSDEEESSEEDEYLDFDNEDSGSESEEGSEEEYYDDSGW